MEANKAKATGTWKWAELMPNGQVTIEFSYKADLVMLVKGFEDRRWHSQEKAWTAPPSIKMIEKLVAAEFQLGAKLQEWLGNNVPKVINPITKIPGLKVEPFPFQYEGIEAVDKFRGRCIIGDDMGLGKTVQGIGWLQLHKEARPAIVVCPHAIKEMWVEKINQWMGKETVQVLSSKPGPRNKLKKASIYILNYDIMGNKIEIIKPKTPGGKNKRKEIPLTGWVDYLAAKNPKAIILDEAHRIKNPTSQRSIGCCKLLKQSPNAICLTGTPIEHRPSEFWPMLNAVAPKHFSNEWKYKKRYCGARHNGFGWDFNGASNMKELHDLLGQTCMIRRLKKDVLKQLPPKQRVVVPLPVEDKYMKMYYQREEELTLALKNKEDKMTVLTKLTAMKQEAVKAKMQAGLEWIEDFLESGEKLIVFAHHHFVIDALKERFGKTTKIAEITGRTVGSRQDQENLFQNDPECQLFLGSKSAKEGLTLTAASNVAFMELFDSPGEIDQAGDRAHRIGQEDQVTSWFLVAVGTIEEKQAQLLDKKLKVLKQVLDSEDAKEEELLTELLKIVLEGGK